MLDRLRAVNSLPKKASKCPVPAFNFCIAALFPERNCHKLINRLSCNAEFHEQLCRNRFCGAAERSHILFAVLERANKEPKE